MATAVLPPTSSAPPGKIDLSDSKASMTETWIPPHLAAYLLDQPMPTAVYAHSSLSEPLKLNSPDKLAPPIYENPAMRALLLQGSGAAARAAGPTAENPPVPASLSETLNERNQAKLRSWLATGLEETLGQGRPKCSSAMGTPTQLAGNGPGSPLHLPQLKRTNSTKPFPSPGLRSPALATVMMTMKSNGDGAGSFPFGFTQAAGEVAGKAEPEPKLADSPSTSGGSSAWTSLSRRTSVSSNSTAATSTAATSRWSARHISLQLATSVNFSKTHWRGTVYPELGITILTQLPSSAIANGGLGFAEYEEDRDVREVPSASSATNGDEPPEEDNAEALAALQKSCAEGVAAWEEASTIAGKREPEEQLNLEDLDVPESEDDEDLVTDPSGSVSPDGSETSSSLSEASRLPISVVMARERLGKPIPYEPIGDNEISTSGAHDSTSLEGMAYTLWHSPVGCFRVDKDLSIVQANPKWRQTCGLPDGESNDSWPSRVHPEDREKVVAHYTRIADELPVERDEYEFRWMPDGDVDRWCTCVIEPAIINGAMAGYSGYLLK